MLLELPGSVLSQMLQDEAMLTAAVDKAVRALQLAQEPRYRLISFLHHHEQPGPRNYLGPIKS